MTSYNSDNSSFAPHQQLNSGENEIQMNFEQYNLPDGLKMNSNSMNEETSTNNRSKSDDARPIT